MSVTIPDDEEFRKELKEALAKPDEWYDERVERAVRGALGVKRRAHRVPKKSRG
jgi:hypothetical protein